MVTRRARSTGRSLSRSLTRPARHESGSHQLRLSSKRGPPSLLQRVPERRRRKRPSVLPQPSEGRLANHSCATTKRFDARHIELLASPISVDQRGQGRPRRPGQCARFPFRSSEPQRAKRRLAKSSRTGARIAVIRFSELFGLFDREVPSPAALLPRTMSPEPCYEPSSRDAHEADNVAGQPPG